MRVFLLSFYRLEYIITVSAFSWVGGELLRGRGVGRGLRVWVGQREGEANISFGGVRKYKALEVGVENKTKIYCDICHKFFDFFIITCHLSLSRSFLPTLTG